MTTDRQKTGPRPRRDGAPPRLQQWLDAHRFTSAQLEAVTKISRQSMTRIRGGKDVRLSTMRRIQAGASRLAERPVRMEELWDLDPDDGRK